MKIKIIIEIYEDNSDDAEIVAVEPNEPYWQDEMDDMMDDYD